MWVDYMQIVHHFTQGICASLDSGWWNRHVLILEVRISTSEFGGCNSVPDSIFLKLSDSCDTVSAENYDMEGSKKI